MGELLDKLKSRLVSSAEEEQAAPLSASKPGFLFQSTLVPVSPEAYCVDGTVLRFVFASLSASSNALCTYRVLLPNGEVKGFSKLLTPTGLYLEDTLDETLPECVLLNAQISAASSYWHGDSYARIELLGSYLTDNNLVWSLANGYISATSPISWPNPRQEHSENPPGFQVFADGTTPAVGNEVSEAVLVTAKVRLVSFQFKLVTSAVAGNRIIRFRLNQGSNIFYETEVQTPIPASTTAFIRGYTYDASATMTAPLYPMMIRNDLWALGDMTFDSVTNGLDAGDQYSAVKYVFEYLKQL